MVRVLRSTTAPQQVCHAHLSSEELEAQRARGALRWACQALTRTVAPWRNAIACVWIALGCQRREPEPLERPEAPRGMAQLTRQSYVSSIALGWVARSIAANAYTLCLVPTTPKTLT